MLTGQGTRSLNEFESGRVLSPLAPSVSQNLVFAFHFKFLYSLPMKDERSAISGQTQNIVGLGCSRPPLNRPAGVPQRRLARIEGYKIFSSILLDLVQFGVV